VVGQITLAKHAATKTIAKSLFPQYVLTSTRWNTKTFKTADGETLINQHSLLWQSLQRASRYKHIRPGQQLIQWMQMNTPSSADKSASVGQCNCCHKNPSSDYNKAAWVLSHLEVCVCT